MKARAVDRDLLDVVHDLGNPAAAAQAASRQLAHGVDHIAELALAATDAAREGLQATRQAARDQRRTDDPDRRAAREVAIAVWLGARSVPDAPRRARDLARAGVSADRLDRHLEGAEPAALAHAVRWIEVVCAADASLGLLETACRRLNDHVRALRGRAQAGVVDVHAGLEGALTIATRDHEQIAVDRAFAANVSSIPGDPNALDRVWSNILHNAVEALRGAGRIWIRTSLEADFARIEIANDGPPIPPELLDEIFERAFTTKRDDGGTGLGLAICRQIIEEHGGTLSVSSTPGRTAFSIRLPVSSTETSS